MYWQKLSKISVEKEFYREISNYKQLMLYFKRNRKQLVPL